MDHETVAAYLHRVGVTAPTAGDAAGLRTLHRAHQLTAPFENLSIHLAEPISRPRPGSGAAAPRFGSPFQGQFMVNLQP